MFLYLRQSFWFLLAVLFLGGCAAPPTEIVIEDTAPLLDEVDSALSAVLGDYLPDPGRWPPRDRVSGPDEFPVELVRTLPVSSLAYFPRLTGRLEGSLREAGFEDFTLSLFQVEGEDRCTLEVRVREETVYRIDLTQTVAGRLALIIDDVGFTMNREEKLLALEYPITVAVLPHLTHSTEWAVLADSRGFEVILHCPLEPINPVLDPGPGTIERGDPDQDIALILEENLRSVPTAVGANNRMGSAFTTDREAMGALLRELKERGLFFIDSLTIGGTATGAAAEEEGISFATRDVFLDHENTEEFILRQLAVLKRKAKINGSAVGIGHYRPLTLEVLARELPSFADEGIQIVPVSALIH